MLRSWRNKRAFARAKAEAETQGRVVCATVLPSGEPRYFTVPPDSTNDQIAAKAFEIREGRALTRGELMLIQAANAHRAKQEQVSGSH